MKINLKNGYVLVQELKRKEEESNTLGIIIPESSLEDEQVSQGIVVEGSDEYPKGITVLFHKVIPIDVNLKLEGDTKLETYFFLPEKDIICSMTEE